MRKPLHLSIYMLLVLALHCPGMTPAAAGEPFEVLFIGQQTIENNNAIAVTFSAEVDATRDISRYFAIVAEDEGQVDGAWVLTPKGNVAYFTHIEADRGYEVEVRKGLRAADGRALADTRRKKIKTRPAKAFISFDGKGYLLPAQLADGLPVNTMNVAAADIDFFRVKPKYLVDFIAFMGQESQLSYYHGDQIRRFCDLVYSARFDLKAPRNVLAKAVLPVRGIEPLETPGLYLAVLRQAGTYPYSTPATYFSISDIGLHMRVYAHRLEAQVNQLTSGKVYAGVTLTLYGKKGEVLEQVQSNKQGRAALNTSWADARLLVATHGKHTSVLPLRAPALDLSAFDLGKQPFRDLELFVYGPRDLYRPGETVILDALLRDYDGRTLGHAAPIQARIKQPDGRQAKSFTWHGDSLDDFHYAYDLPVSAQTGTWSVEFALGGRMIQLYQFKVEDFMPERMKLTLDNGDPDPKRIDPKDAIALAVQGDYLYGAPAAGNRVGCRVSMTLARALVQKLPGFEFGDVDEKVGDSFDTDELSLDEKGQGVIQVASQWNKVRSPINIRLHTSLYESGGRSVSRAKRYTMWPARQLIGVRPLWDGDQPDADALVEFEVVNSEPDGKLLAVKNLAVTVVREYPDYYWEYNANSGWQRIVNYQHYPVARFKLDVPAGKPAKISFPVEWGPYRLEIRNPRTDLVTSLRFSAGWSWWGRGADQQGSRPDQVVLTLDKPAYQPGDTARVLIKAPEAGTAVVNVEGDRSLWHTVVDVAAGGSQVEIPVSADWARHDLYISALVIRPGDRRSKITPKRALGLIHLPLERSARRLAVSIKAVEKALPNAPLTVNLQVDGDLGGGRAFVTLAAVDVGVLSITDYKTPDPATYFFNRRRYGVDCYDLYQKIIETGQGSLAKRRFGGDAMLEMARGGDKPLTDVRIVSLYQGRLAVDEKGRAKAVLDLPDFNGRLRLMAVAYSDSTYGAAEKEVTVAAPVVAEIAMPRFLSMGDQAFLALDVQNLSGVPQQLGVHLTTTDPIQLTEEKVHSLNLADKQKVTLRYAIQAGQSAGLGDIDLRIDGILAQAGAAPVALHRKWRLGTRPAYPAITRQWRKSLEPGQTLAIEPRVLKHLLAQTVRANLVVSGHPPIDVARHVRELFAYPYGCLEQTTSGIYPQVFLSRTMLDQLGIKTQEESLRRKKVAKGIDRLLSLQKPSGGFGLWSSSSPEECWLSAYVTDFLITARDQGYEVSGQALTRALDRLAIYLRKPGTVTIRYSEDNKHASLAARAYSAYVLSRLNRASLGTLRSLFDNHAKESRTGLPLVHLGVALELMGDGRRADQAYAQALDKAGGARHYYGDYGSPLRDAAMAYVLLSTHAPGKGEAAQWLVKLDDALHEREWLSTQERNALVLAGVRMLSHSGKTWQARLEGRAAETLSSQGMLSRAFTFDQLTRGLRLKAVGDQPVYVNLVLSGYSDQPPPAETHGLTIHRTCYDLKGRIMTPDKLKTGDLVLVRLDVSSDQRVSEGLVVDLLPAGLELENQNLAVSFNMDELKVEDKTIQAWKQNLNLAHEEYRDDRYVAAVDISQWRPSTLFYLARAVSPGVFQMPNAYVEDMYRPYLRSVGDKHGLLTIEQP